jgi:cyclophilin family peptidyl-prolyl cis-trans isomerase
MRITVAGISLNRLFAAVGLLMVSTIPALISANTLLRMQTDLGGVDIELFDTQAPQTVANFLNYVNRGDYDGTFIHRSVPGFVVQGGGYIFNPENGDFFGSGTSHIPVDAPVVNEPDPVNRPNLRGTLAMAKTSDPDSATSEWFFNLADNASLDDPNNSGGFTVFGQVTGSGMAVWDTVAGLSRCIDVAPLPFLCGSFTEVPAVNWNQAVSNDTLINIVHIGTDTDGDGVIDSLEDAAPNGGDANNDGIRDSTQESVVSFPDSTGNYVVIETSAGVTVHDLDILGTTFGLANPPTVPGELDALGFSRGYFGFELDGVSPGGATSVTETFNAGPLMYTYYNFGPTPDNAIPHWYEFLYDGTTGAEIIGNKIIVHLVDGARGDGDLDNANGVIKASPGGAAINLQADTDGDGVPDAIENAAPNAGDANSDGILDSVQSHIASLPDRKGAYITLEVDALLKLTAVSIASASPAGAGALAGLTFSNGYPSFGVSGVAPGDRVEVKITLPPGAAPNTYYLYGPTPYDSRTSWYEFSFNGEVGAMIAGNVITLTLADGKLGDGDLDKTNGMIQVSPGGPVTCGDADGDCFPDVVEDAAPNNGDGNNDGIADSTQNNVISFPNAINNNYVTLITTSPLVFRSGRDQLLILSTKPSKTIQGLNFTNSLFGFSVVRPNSDDAGAVTVEVILPEGVAPTTYYKYGPTPDNSQAHWYEFMYDGETGAEINGNHITLHFVDGQRGDSDLVVNGVIVDPGAPAQKANISGSSGGGGGCSLIGQSRNPAQAGAWWIIFSLILLLRLKSVVRVRSHL